MGNESMARGANNEITALSTYWNSILVEGFHLEQRLARLERTKVVSFGAGCAEHIVRHFVGIYDLEGIDSTALTPFTDVWESGLKECWTAVSGQSQVDAIAAKIRRVDDRFLDEDVLESATTKGAYNIDQITASVYKAMECTKYGGHVGYAIGAAHSAYEAILMWYVMRMGETVTWTEEESVSHQSGCAQCSLEIEFQKRYMEALEAIQAEPPLYATMLQQMQTKR